MRAHFHLNFLKWLGSRRVEEVLTLFIRNRYRESPQQADLFWSDETESRGEVNGQISL